MINLIGIVMPGYAALFAQSLLVLLTLCGDLMAQHRPGERSKVPPSFPDRLFSSGTYRVMVKDSTGFRNWFAKNYPNAQARPAMVGNVYHVSGLRGNDVRKMLNAPVVTYIEPAHRRAFPEGNVPGLDLTLNSVTTVHHLYPSLAGNGLRVSVKENAFNKDDLDLIGRVLKYEAMPAAYDQHATAIATIISGAGNTSPAGKGVAWKSNPVYADFSNLMPEPTAGLIADDISVQNHSYGVGVENYYGIESYAYDDQCVQYPSIVHVFSAGNSGAETGASGTYEGITGYANLTGQFKISKNTIAVGGTDREGVIDPLSSRGPASDGRIKPEVVAYGNGGTSEAAAIVSGMCVLAQQAFKDLYDSLPPSALVKAALFNSADDAGNPHVDHTYGYGIADAHGLIRTISDGNFFFGSVSEGAAESFSIEVPNGVEQLKVTLAWIDPAGEPGSGSALVNDLDLTLIEEATSAAYKPWVLSTHPHIDSLKKVAGRDEDRMNVVEQITVDRPAQGFFTVQVTGYDISSAAQPFSIAYELKEGLQWVYPTGSDAVEAGKEIFIRWDWAGADTPAKIQWRISGAGSWEDAGEVYLLQKFFRWVTPEADEVLELRIVADEAVLWTESFTVSRQPDLQVGYDCDDEAMFFWGFSVPEYEVYKLGEKFLEPAAVLSDTVFRTGKNEGSARYFSVAPRINGIPGVRSRTMTYDVGIEYCYVRSFLARELVSDSVYLDLSLGTNLGLNALFLERGSGGDFGIIREFSPVNDINFSFYDPDPLPGMNRYRVRLERENNGTVLSNVEEVWYSRPGDLVYFPNPVIAGQILNVVVESDPVTIVVYDAAGRLVRRRVEDGEIKTIDTSGLKPGLFLMKIFAGSGVVLTARIAIK